MPAFTSGDLVDLIEKNDAGLLHTVDRRTGHAFHVNQLLRLLCRQVLESLGYRQAAAKGPSREHPGQHVPKVDTDFLDRRALNDLKRRHGAIANLNLDDFRVEAA